jgi:drug/metabolite transporter (DMT)-like permease/heme-degrading monooxygenase HmoA
MKNLKSERWLIPISFAIIYLVWGSTYLVNWYAIQDIPPLLMSGSRFFTAGTILFLASYFFRKSKPDWKQWKNAALMGTLFLAVGTGGMVWAEQFISSGMVALMVAFQPLMIVLMMWQMEGKRPSARTIAGTTLGMLGMFFLVGQDQFLSDKQTLLGLGVIFVSIFSWAYASMKVRKVALPESKLQSAGMQMMGGGGALLLTSLLTGEAFQFQAEALTTRGAWSWIYLVLLGSIVAFSAFNYLLVKSSPDKVATSNYVNPVVALLLGWGLNNEAITGQSLIAATLLLTGVAFINSRFGFLKKFSFGRPRKPGWAGFPTDDAEGVKEIDISPFACSAMPMGSMIVRIWHGTTPPDKAEEYVEFAKNKVVPEFQAIPGNLGLTLTRRNEGDVSHMTLVSYWKDVDSIKQFAGEDYGKARYFPEEQNLLLDFEKEVEHKEIAV